MKDKFLLRAKVGEWNHTSQREYTRWVEGHLNLVAVTNEGPKYAFAELECGKLAYYIGQNWCYQPVMHTTYHSNTIGRYVGFNDKNNKKIFEGDIIRFCGGYAEGNWVGAVEYSDRNAQFVAKGIEPCRRCSSDTGEFEVALSDINKATIEIIGNKWDNADILEDPYVSR